MATTSSNVTTLLKLLISFSVRCLHLQAATDSKYIISIIIISLILWINSKTRNSPEMSN